MTSTYLPDSDSDDELPAGWSETVTDDGLVCYINQQTKSTQCNHPRTGHKKLISADLPTGWHKYIDKQLNRVVFKNINTNQTSIIDPRLAFSTEQPSCDISKVRQRFDSSTTALQVLHGRDLSGCLALITGANEGIGFETARSMVLGGCCVVFACRNWTRTQKAINQICREKPSARDKCIFLEIDLASFKSIKNFLQQVKKKFSYIDYLILNAGVFGLPYVETEDGVEHIFQVCHLSQFYLTVSLETMFNDKSRVIILSSESHRFSNLPSENLSEAHLCPNPDKFWSMMAYNNAKMCNVLFCKELAKRWRSLGISVFAVHPGNMVNSNLSRHWYLYKILFFIVRPFTKSLQQAAATTVYCATAKELTGLSGYYFNNCYFCDPSKLCQNEILSGQLWNISIEIINRIDSELFNI